MRSHISGREAELPGALRSRKYTCGASLILLIFFAFQSAIFAPVNATQLPVYSDTLLAEWQQRYPRGVLSNYNGVILPRLDPADRRMLDGVTFEFPLRIENREPFAFAADAQGRTIYMSVQSLKFLDDASIAIAWLDRNGYTIESLTNYFAMLRHWSDAAPPPPLLPTLCIPLDALENPEVDQLAQKSFSTAIFFVMLHEIGHVVYRHGGYEGVDAAVARAREEKADAFALEVMARVGDAPLGVVNLFLAMAYLFEGRTDFSSDTVHERQLATRTHPLSAERLRSFADTLEKTAADYTGSGLSRVAIIGTAAQIRIVAQNFLDIERLTAMIGRSISPADLGPMRMGDKIGRPCAEPVSTGEPFSGRLTGMITIDNIEFDLQAELTRSGSRVEGRSSYGAGVSSIEGIIEGNTLHYRWRLRQDAGKGALTHAGGSYEGSWGNGEDSNGGGIIRLWRQ